MSRLLIVILAALGMLGALSIDAYLPAFPAIGKQFSASEAAVQQSLTAYVLAFAFMTLFYGTLSDSFGRRRIVLISLVFYFFGTIGAAFASSLEMLIAFRLVQGLSAGAGAVIGRAIVSDMYEGAEAQRIMSWISVVFGLAPALAPILGGWLLTFFDWRAIFYFIAIFTFLLFIACLLALPESLAPEKRQEFHPKVILANYLEVAGHPRVLLRITSIALAFSGVMIYVAAAPAFVIGILHLSVTEFSWLFVPLIGGMTLGSLAAGKMSHRMRPEAIIGWSFVIMIVAAAAGLAHGIFLPMKVPSAILPIIVYSFGASAAAPAMIMTAIEMFPAVRGLASSLQTFLFLLLFSLVSGLIVPHLFGSPVRFAIITVASAILSPACWLLAAALREKRA